jgi:hypothetical protein
VNRLLDETRVRARRGGAMNECQKEAKERKDAGEAVLSYAEAMTRGVTARGQCARTCLSSRMRDEAREDLGLNCVDRASTPPQPYPDSFSVS